MILDPTVVRVDIKVQDRLRELISRLGGDNSLIQLKCVILGDSDIDYEITNMDNARILNAPYNVEAIKYPLIYNGLGKGIKGEMATYVRFVDANGVVSSMYNYPNSNVATPGRVPPTRLNGLDFLKLDFTNNKMGMILFNQTLLDYYRDDNNVQKRLKETYGIKVFFNGVESVPNGWQITYDTDNGSLLIGKNSVALQFPSQYLGTISITGNTTGISKTIFFNY